MEFLVKKVWSLIAHKYSLNTLESCQLIKEQLIGKLMNAKNDSIEKKKKYIQIFLHIIKIINVILKKINLRIEEQDQLFSLNDEINSFTNSTDVIKSKILYQNETMKKIIRQMESLKTCSMKSTDQNQPQTSNEVSFLN